MLEATGLQRMLPHNISLQVSNSLMQSPSKETRPASDVLVFAAVYPPPLQPSNTPPWILDDPNWSHHPAESRKVLLASANQILASSWFRKYFLTEYRKLVIDYILILLMT